MEKGEVLLETVHDPTISDNLSRLQTDYQDICTAAKVGLTTDHVFEFGSNSKMIVSLRQVHSAT